MSASQLLTHLGEDTAVELSTTALADHPEAWQDWPASIIQRRTEVAMARKPKTAPTQFSYDASCQDCRGYTPAGTSLYYVHSRFLCVSCAYEIEIAEGGL